MSPPSPHDLPSGRDAAPESRLNRVGAAVMLPEVLRDLGLDVNSLFTAEAIDPSRFSDPEALVPIADLARLVSLSIHASGRTDLGLLVAGKARADKIGLLGALFVSADDLRAALHDFIRFFHLTTRGGVATLTVDGPAAEVQIALVGPYGDASIVFEDAVVGILFHAMKKFLGQAWRPTEVLISHAPTPDSEPYRRFFNAPVRFNALCTAIVFPAADLERRMFAREAERRRLETAATLAAARLAIGIDEQVRWTIRAHLGRTPVTIGLIAGALGVSVRTLNRRLADRGLTFARLLRDVRFATARQLLAESDTPLAEIASAVGYGDPTIFSTAFRLWSSLPPRDWRRLHGRR